jgi:hypothetical protein
MTDTAPALHHDAAGVVDFTKPRDLRRFRIDNDVFECAAAIPVNLARKLAKTRASVAGAEGLTEENAASNPELIDRMMDVVIEILESIMLPDSAKRFAERMGSITEPIDLGQLVAVSNWLMEDLGERPTSPGFASSDSSSMTATTATSTAGVPLEVSTPIASPLPVS